MMTLIKLEMDIYTSLKIFVSHYLVMYSFHSFILKSNLKGFGSMSMCLPYYKDHNRVQRMTVNF